MATKTASSSSSSLSPSPSSPFSPTPQELSSLRDALEDATFRQMLVDYAREASQPETRQRYERELIQLERERGMHCTFLHPTPGFVLKTVQLGVDSRHKTFVNVCSDANVEPPTSEGVAGGLEWRLPHVQSQPRPDKDQAGRPCTVYDVIFHPEALDLARRNAKMDGFLAETALEAVESAFDVKLARGGGQLKRLQRTQFKGVFAPTVIRKPLEPPADVNVDVVNVSHTPKYEVKYRHRVTDLPANHQSQPGGRRAEQPCRPTDIVVVISLPDLETTQDVELDVAERQLSLHAREPRECRLTLPLSYPVMEEEGSAKFDKTTRKLTVVMPVRPEEGDKLEVQRLTSTDSGIEVDCDDDASFLPTSETTQFQPKEERQFPAYSCNIYEDLMIFTLDVKKVDELSLSKSPLTEESFGFRLDFSSLGDVSNDYCFCCAVDSGCDAWDSMSHLDVEVWDNNVILKVSLPSQLACDQYKVGPSPNDLTIHALPQLRALRKKKEKMLKKSFSEDFISDDIAADDVLLQEEMGKERHSSGESEDSAIAGSPPMPASAVASSKASPRFYVTPVKMKKAGDDNEEEEVYTDIFPTPQLLLADESKALRSILKRRNQRCFSKSDCLPYVGAGGDSVASHISSIPEEAEADVCVSSSKKSVHFNEIVHRQVFRPNASILGQKSKNLKKNEQKRRRAAVRRASEGDTPLSGGKASFEDAQHTDSGVASSVDENEPTPALAMALTLAPPAKQKSKRVNKKKAGGRKNVQKQGPQQRFVDAAASNDLMFDLDI